MLGVLYLLLQVPPNLILSSTPPINCIGNFNPTVEWIYDKLNESDQISFNSDACSFKRKVNKINPEKLFITNGRLQGANVVCISDKAEKPCSLVVAEIINSPDPRETLKIIFDYEEKLDSSGPIEESIERLLIRPAEIIYPEQEYTSENTLNNY